MEYNRLIYGLSMSLIVPKILSLHIGGSLQILAAVEEFIVLL